jgi:putative hydrolase of the HAD superfamily
VSLVSAGLARMALMDARTGTATWRGRPVTGVLFDLDDTLVDHRGAVERGLRVWLAGLGLGDGLEEHVDRWFTLEAFHYPRFVRAEISHVEQRRARIRAFFGSCDLDDDAVADDVFAGYLACYRAAWSAFADAGAALARVRELGLPAGILTNGLQSAQEEKVRRTGLASYGVPVYASSSLPAAKPDPRAFQHACADLGVDPAGVVMVGDSLRHDVEGARAAGMAGVLIDRTGRYRSDEVQGVDQISSLAELVLARA